MRLDLTQPICPSEVETREKPFCRASSVTCSRSQTRSRFLNRAETKDDTVTEPGFDILDLVVIQPGIVVGYRHPLVRIKHICVAGTGVGRVPVSIVAGVCLPRREEGGKQQQCQGECRGTDDMFLKFHLDIPPNLFLRVIGVTLVQTLFFVYGHSVTDMIRGGWFCLLFWRDTIDFICHGMISSV